jgi:hypothetical protein
MTREVALRSSVGAEVRTDGLAERPRIVVILPRGEAIRNFVYSGALDATARHASLTLLSVIPSEETETVLRARYGEVLQLRQNEERWIVRILRELLDTAHGRWLWSKAAQHRWQLRTAEANSVGRVLKLWAKRVASYPFANPTGLALLSKAETVSSRLLRTTDDYLCLFAELKPSLVFNTSHVHSQNAIPAVQAAKWLGIPTAAFIFSWDNLTSQGRIIPPYDYYLVWNDSVRNQLMEIYPSVRSDRVRVTGTPQFDFHFKPEFHWTREQFCAHVGADPNRPIVLYTTGMANHMPGEPRIVEGIADLLLEMTDIGPPQLLVRVYPKDGTGRFEELKRRRQDVLFPRVPWETAWLTPTIQDAYLLTNMLLHAAAGVNIASTVSLELCMLDKPVINVGYNPPGIEIDPIDYRDYYKFDHYSPLVESGAVKVGESEHEMRILLRQALTEPRLGSVLRRTLIKNMFGDKLGSQSAEQLSASLLELAGFDGKSS